MLFGSGTQPTNACVQHSLKEYMCSIYGVYKIAQVMLGTTFSCKTTWWPCKYDWGHQFPAISVSEKQLKFHNNLPWTAHLLQIVPWHWQMIFWVPLQFHAHFCPPEDLREQWESETHYHRRGESRVFKSSQHQLEQKWRHFLQVVAGGQTESCMHKTLIFHGLLQPSPQDATCQGL